MHTPQTVEGEEEKDRQVYVLPAQGETLPADWFCSIQALCMDNYQDEITSLREQAESLRNRVAELEKDQAGGKRFENQLLGANVEYNNLMFAGMQSMLSAINSTEDNSTNPLKASIHLPVDLDERIEVMTGLYEPQIRVGLQFMEQRTRFLDLSIPQRQTETFELPRGDTIVMELDVTHFKAGHSLRQVHEALLFFINNQEMSVSEKLGILTIRESDETEDFLFCQMRLLSAIPNAAAFELNAVMFMCCQDATKETPAFAIGVMNSVDQDDVYPYRPDCARKDVTSVITLTEVPSATGGPPTIAFSRWSHVRLHPPPVPVSKEKEADTRDAMSLKWCDMISKVMHERLALIRPVPFPFQRSL